MNETRMLREMGFGACMAAACAAFAWYSGDHAWSHMARFWLGYAVFPLLSLVSDTWRRR